MREASGCECRSRSHFINHEYAGSANRGVQQHWQIFDFDCTSSDNDIALMYSVLLQEFHSSLITGVCGIIKEGRGYNLQMPNTAAENFTKL